MYRFLPARQQSVDQFQLSSERKLSRENRWVKLAQLVPWDEFEAEYAQQFSPTQGSPAKSFRVALGALIIKERLGMSDEETVEQIRENPYLQYFLGFDEYTETPPFEASMFVHFRKRLSLSMVGRVNERMVQRAMEQPTPTSESDQPQDPQATPPVEGEEGEATSYSEIPMEEQPEADHQTPPEVNNQEQLEAENQGKLIVDATCAPIDIHYPTDLGLLNSAREHTEAIIDKLYEQVKDNVSKKPRTYRQKARQNYLNVSKKRRLSAKQRRKAIRKQLGYVGRNLSHIEQLIKAGASLSVLTRYRYRTLLVVSELFRQQQWMYQHRTQRIDDRIVSLSQPHVRPIVRGKAGIPVEFGAKLSASCSDGFVFLDRLSWDNFNESGDLQQQAEAYKARFGHYPDTIYADAIYRTRTNRKWCNDHNIRLMGPPLGRPAEEEKAVLRQQAREDEKIRNHIEGKFGQSKRRFSLSRVMAKLASTAETAIAISFLVMNLEYLFRQVCWFLFCLFAQWLRIRQQSIAAEWQLHKRYQPADCTT